MRVWSVRQLGPSGQNQKRWTPCAFTMQHSKLPYGRHPWRRLLNGQPRWPGGGSACGEAAPLLGAAVASLPELHGYSDKGPRHSIAKTNQHFTTTDAADGLPDATERQLYMGNNLLWQGRGPPVLCRGHNTGTVCKLQQPTASHRMDSMTI